MSRRSSFVSDILGLVSTLPWPGGVVLSAVTFILCRMAADRTAVSVEAEGAAALGQTTIHALYGTITRIGEWVLPPLMLVGAGASWWKRRRRMRLLDRAKEDPRDLESLSWRDFERLVGEAFRRQGYSVV